MSRLSLLLGVFLAVTVTGIVFLLAVLSKVPFVTIISRSAIVFLLFGTLGTILGSILEVFLVPDIVKKNLTDIKKNMKLQEDEAFLTDLGDLLESGMVSNSENILNHKKISYDKEDETVLADLGNLLETESKREIIGTPTDESKSIGVSGKDAATIS